MKAFEELTTKEMSELTNEQTRYYEELTLMESGLSFPPEPMLEDVPEMPVLSKKTFYVVALKGTNQDAVYTSIEHANDAARLISGSNDYDYSIDYETRYCNFEATAEVRSVELFDQKEVKRAKSTLQEIKRIKDENDTTEREYDKAFRACSVVVEDLRRRFGIARTKMATSAETARRYNRFLELTEDDALKAFKCLLENPDLDRDTVIAHLEQQGVADAAQFAAAYGKDAHTGTEEGA